MNVPAGAAGDSASAVVFDRVDPDRIVTMGQQVGIFTPVSGLDVGLQVDNLAKIVDVLRRRIVELESENAALLAKLESVRPPSRNPDEVSGAIAGALDRLQARLAQAADAETAFAVRELTLDTAVGVDVSSAGVVEFRFPQPGDDPKATALSRLHISAVPIPRAEDAPPAGGDVPIDRLVGLPTAARRRLEDAGITTAGTLVQVVNRARVSTYLEGLLGVDRATLRTWSAEAELVTVAGIGGAHARLLTLAGVASTTDLAARQPDELTAVLRKLAKANADLAAKPFDVDTVAGWITAAAARRTAVATA